MKLNTRIESDREQSLVKIYISGALNSDTAMEFEPVLEDAINQRMKLNVLDMRNLDYISSAGLRVIFKAAKTATSRGQHLAASHRKPHIEKVFEILKALPDMAVFANDQELDDYLTLMQERNR
ncbi:MAG: STAS domain-containing protein [Parahaliea sp.]